MNINLVANRSRRAAYVKAQTNAAQAEKKADSPAPAYTPAQDEVVISSKAREVLAKQGTDSASSVDAISEEQTNDSKATTFTTFAEEFSKITEDHANTIREYYSAEHQENLLYDSPSTHIWNKYKNPDSPDFRADLSEDERAWAYDQELDLLSGGKHLQMGNPYAFASVGGAPTLASAAMQANQACRKQIDQAIQDIFAESGIEVPVDAAFRLTADQPDYAIHVYGLYNPELTEAIEQALNRGDNGKNLYDHLKLTVLDGGALGVDYVNGHLADVNTRQEMDDEALSEVMKQAGPISARYSGTYDPHQESMNEQILSLNPNSPLNTQENKDRISAAIRVSAPELIAEFRARKQDMGFAIDQNRGLIINQDREIDPDNSIALKTYLQAYAQPVVNVIKTIEEYYAKAHAENSAYPLPQGLEHIEDKYRRPDSGIFRADIPEDEREMAYRQERALLTGTPLDLFDPYALASVGGMQAARTPHQRAMQAVWEKLSELSIQRFGAESIR